MKLRPQYLNEIANTPDLPSVSVCFQDREIGALFAALLVSRGVTPLITECPACAAEGTKIVTEPCFFPDLTAEQIKYCLVVGPKKSLKSIKARCLEQPLTEDGVESALEYLSLPIPPG